MFDAPGTVEIIITDDLALLKLWHCAVRSASPNEPLANSFQRSRSVSLSTSMGT